MVNAMIGRLRVAALLGLTTSLWCWLLTTLHCIWSFGIVLGYLDGGQVPLYPEWSVTYGGFLMDAIGAFLVPFVLIFTLCTVLPHRFHLASTLTAWVIGAWVGADNTAFVYQIDFGTTWGPTDALRALFYHPIVTPLWLMLGLAGTVTLTRNLRTRTS